MPIKATVVKPGSQLKTPGESERFLETLNDFEFRLKAIEININVLFKELRKAQNESQKIQR